MKQREKSREKLRTCGVKERLYFLMMGDSSPYLYVNGSDQKRKD